MIIRNTKPFFKGLIMVVSFLGVLILMFSPISEGRNALEAADDLFNSISKGSVGFFPDLWKRNETYKGVPFQMNLNLKNAELSAKAEKLLTAAGVAVERTGEQVGVKGILGDTLATVIRDSEAMFANSEQALVDKYGLSGREALFVWWNILKQMDAGFTKQKEFKSAAFVSEVRKKGVEVGYNFFSIESAHAGSKAGILTFSMVFYVIYTLWYGMGLLFLFEGIGMQLKAKAKKEV